MTKSLLEGDNVGGGAPVYLYGGKRIFSEFSY